MRKQLLKRHVLVSDSGFTVVEMIVVIIVAGILGAIAIVRYSSHQDNAIMGAASQIISDIAYAQEMAIVNAKGTAIYFYGNATPPPRRRCFIASVCFGPESQAVTELRGFRDQFLMHNTPGRTFVNWYYDNAPDMAKILEKNRILRWGMTALLTPVVVLISPFVDEAQAFGGGGGGGQPAGTPNTYQIIFQNGTPIKNPQTGQDYVVYLGTEVTITSPNRTLYFDSNGKMSTPGYTWSSGQTSMTVVVLNGDVNIQVSKYIGKAWVQQ